MHQIHAYMIIQKLVVKIGVFNPIIYGFYIGINHKQRSLKPSIIERYNLLGIYTTLFLLIQESNALTAVDHIFGVLMVK